MSEQLYSLQAEKHVLSGLIKYPDVLFEIDNHYNDRIFHNDVHRTIYNIIKNIILKGDRKKNDVLDPLLIGQKVKDLGIKFKDDIDIIDYISSFSIINISEKAIKNAAEELEKLRVCRDITKTSEQIIKQVRTVGDKTIEQIVDTVDQLYSANVKVTSSKTNPELILTNIVEEIEARANEPLEEMGLITPHKEFNLKFGGLRPGDIYAFVSRPKEGKTTFLTDLVTKCTQVNSKCKALILDTEMRTKDINMRIASSITNIPTWWLETGNWIKKPEYARAWQEKKHLLGKNRPVYHINVAGKPINEVRSLIRRWYYQNIRVEEGETAVIDYDYIKITGETSNDMKEWQLVGEKINSFKELALELSIPIVTSCQLNRDGARGIHSTASIAMSDRLTWFASFVGIFRKKTMEEMAEHGVRFGTHVLDPLVYRFEGRDSFGHFDYIRTEDDDGTPINIKNVLHYNVTNFNVEEVGTTRDVINNRNLIAEQGNEPEEDIREL